MILFTSHWFSGLVSRLLLPQLPRLARLTFLASGYPICAGMDQSRVTMSVVSIILVPS